MSRSYISRLRYYYNNDIIRRKYLHDRSRQHIFPKQRRVIVIGDIHGDLEVAIKCLILAKCIKSSVTLPRIKTVEEMNNFFNNLEWVGDDTYIVQLGDQIDRVRPQTWDDNDIPQDAPYEDEGSTLEIFYLFYHLDKLARKYGGRVLSLIGNHEIMNVDGDFRYVSREEFKCFKNHLQRVYHRSSRFPYNSKTLKRGHSTMRNNTYRMKTRSRVIHGSRLPEGYRERLYAFAPTGLCANFMAMNYHTILQIGNWLFCHGSPTLYTCKNYMNQVINDNVANYLLGVDDGSNRYKDEDPSETSYKKITDSVSMDDDSTSILWSRTFGKDNHEYKLSRMLDKVLTAYNNTNVTAVTHVAIGHTPQFNKGINSICNGRVWRCDIGMSKAFKRDTVRVQVLEIVDNESPRILTLD